MNISAKLSWIVGISLPSILLPSILFLNQYQKTIVTFKTHDNYSEGTIQQRNEKNITLHKINITYNNQGHANPCSPYRQVNIKTIKTITSSDKVEVFMNSYMKLCNQYDTKYYPKKNGTLCLCIPKTISKFIRHD